MRLKELGKLYPLQKLTSIVNANDLDGDGKLNYNGKNLPFGFKIRFTILSSLLALSILIKGVQITFWLHTMCVQSAARIAAVYKGEHDGIEHPGYSSIKMTAVLVGNFEKNP